MKKFIIGLVVFSLLILAFSGCVGAEDYSSCNILLHEGKVSWVFDGYQCGDTVTFEDGASYTGWQLGVIGYDGKTHDRYSCSISESNCQLNVARHVYTDTDYKIYGSFSKTYLLLIPSDLDKYNPIIRQTLNGGE
jgi:hypothetical protein